MSKVEWEKVRLGDICEVITGNTPKTSDVENYNSHDIPFYKPSDISENKVSLLSESENYVSYFSKKSIRLLPADSILVTCIGTIGKIGLTETRCCSNQQINALIPKKGISTKFLAYSLFNKKEALKQIANAPVVPIINKTQFSNFQVTIPASITHQRHIAATLDKANEMIALHKKQLSELDALAESVFYDMFGDPVKNEKGWERGTIADTVQTVNYGTSSPAVEDGKYKYLRMNNITYSGYLDLRDLKYINVENKDKEKYIVRKGDLLFNRTNSKELVGKTAIFTEEEEMIIAGYIIRVRCNSLFNSRYVWGYLNCRHGKAYLKNLCKNIVGMANINAKELQGVLILLPPLALQTRFATIIEKIEEQKAQVRKALQESEDLFQKLMQDLFRPD